MKIKKEDFNKLKQLDQVLYLLKKDRIEKNNEAEYPSFKYIIGLIIFQIFFMLIWYSAFKTFNNLVQEINIFKFAFIILALVWLFEMIVYIFYMLKQKKEGKELFDEYFKIEVNK